MSNLGEYSPCPKPKLEVTEVNTLLQHPDKTLLLKVWLFLGLQNGFPGPSLFTHRRKSGTTASTVFEGDISLLFIS